jgi:uncharacterized Zn finger protein
VSPADRVGTTGSGGSGRGAPPRRPGSRRGFGESWWGAAWIDALEQRARLDPNRLPRGRTYARSGAVGALSVAPGEVLAEVQGSRRSPYKVKVRVRPFAPAEWERVLDALSAEIGHTAALLEGELPSAIADDVASVGLDLLPGAGELQPRCSCPDWADPCKHAAAVCYLIADVLDADPFTVLLLRGRTREEVLAALRARRGDSVSPRTADALGAEPSADAGVVARDAWARTPAALPSLPALPRRALRPTVLAADPPPGTGLDVASLRSLAADAAERALLLARGAGDHGLLLSLEQDLARRAARLVGSGDAPGDGEALEDLARRAGLAVRELAMRGRAWRDGGAEGLGTLSESWDPDPRALEVGRRLLPGAVARHNRLTRHERQLRLGRDGRFYPYRKDHSGRFSPDGPPLGEEIEESVGALEDPLGPDAPAR